MTELARLRAAFYRGGTSKAVVFNAGDLPPDRATRDAVFLHVLGSPDRYGRQLDGMGGGLSSLSKVVIVQPSARDDADVDYTFVQIGVDKPLADYGSACGNMSSCVGPFAVEEGMVTPADGQALVRIHDTNTSRIYHAHFEVRNGRAVETGEFTIPGVSGSGAPIKLDFLAPGGAATGRLLPTGQARGLLKVAGLGTFDASLIDSSNPVIFVRAEDLGKTATEPPQELDGDADFMDRVERIRRAGAVAMGLAGSVDDVAASNPKLAILSGPAGFTALDGQAYLPGSHDINVRLVSMGNFHRAVTLTGAMCMAVAAQIEGSLVRDLARPDGAELRIGNPSGVLPATADVVAHDDQPDARSAGTFRTHRRIMEGSVLVPAHLLEGPR